VHLDRLERKSTACKTWYSKECLESLVDHELRMNWRVQEKGVKLRVHDSSWRGFEHIHQQYDKAQHCTSHVRYVLAFQDQMKKVLVSSEQARETLAEQLRVVSSGRTKEDRKQARKLGKNDAMAAEMQDGSLRASSAA